VAGKGSKKGFFGRLIRGVLMLVLVFGLVGPVLTTAVYRIVPPPITWLMIQRMFEGHGLRREWKPLDEISPRLVRTLIAAEDARFCEHRGFDFNAIEKAMASNAKGRKLRGGSTISQQTAKNVFLWPQRSWVRKGLEAYFTVLIEVIWGKPRIMEVYLNTIEWGPGVYGAEAAARKNFGVSAKNLSAAQAARLAAIVPSPLKWRAASPGPYVKRRSGKITRAAGAVRRTGMAACVLG
jgi:monofunctional biosynthetic peptidoglycan transglycosylase